MILIFCTYSCISFLSFCFFTLYLNNYQNVCTLGYVFSSIDNNINYILGNEKKEYLNSIQILLNSDNLNLNMNLLNSQILIDYYQKLEDYLNLYELSYIQYLNYFLIDENNQKLLFVLQDSIENI